MAKLKLKKYPKPPKKTASLATKQNFIAKCRTIDAENRAAIAEKKKSEQLDKQISGLVSVRKLGSFTNVLYSRRKKKATKSISGVKRGRKTAKRKRK